MGGGNTPSAARGHCGCGSCRILFRTPAIDATTLGQTASDLDQQIELAKTKLARAEKLLATNAGTRGQVEETELQLRGLQARRAALNASQVKTETLIAPVDGVIAGTKALPGQVVAPQDSC